MTLFPPNANKGRIVFQRVGCCFTTYPAWSNFVAAPRDRHFQNVFVRVQCMLSSLKGGYFNLSACQQWEIWEKKKKANKRAALNQVGRGFQKLKAVAGMPVSLQIFISMTVKRKGNNKQKLSSFLTCSFCHLHGSNSMLIPEQSNNFFNESWIKMWFATANENAFCSNAGVLIELRRARRLERALNNMSQTFFIYFFCSLAVWCLQMGPAALGRN